MKRFRILFYGSLLVLFLLPVAISAQDARPRQLFNRVYIDETGKVLSTEKILPKEGVAYPTKDEYIVVPGKRVGKMKIKASNGSTPAGQAMSGTGNIGKGALQLGTALTRTIWGIVNVPFHRRRDRVVYERPD